MWRDEVCFVKNVENKCRRIGLHVKTVALP